jgi:hypothetical protein
LKNFNQTLLEVLSIKPCPKFLNRTLHEKFPSTPHPLPGFFQADPE